MVVTAPESNLQPIERGVVQLFALVSEAISRSTEALLGGRRGLGQAVIDGDQVVDDLASQVEMLIWDELNRRPVQGPDLRHMVALLLIIPELERSADLAEHIAQRAMTNLGVELNPVCRGIVQLMTEVASELWTVTADAYADRSNVAARLVEMDEEMDSLHDRLTAEIENEAMAGSVTAQVALIARFYERLGDHAVNLGRRIDLLHDAPPADMGG